MIDPRCFTETWQRDQRVALSATAVDLFDKTVHAFALLHLLADSGLEFVFKGGTSILLLREDFRRLSIDIDIHTPVKSKELRKRLEQIIEQGHGPFTRYEEDVRDSAHRNPQPERSHFKFYYLSEAQKGESHILLDVVEEASPIQAARRSATPSFLPTTVDSFVYVPSVDALIGDKLTAYATNTTGVPFDRGDEKQEIKVVKHLFDIHALEPLVERPADVADAFRRVVAAQNGYRKTEHTPVAVAKDIRDMAYAYVRDRENGEGKRIETGRTNLKGHLVRSSFSLQECYLAGARAAAWAAWAASTRQHPTTPTGKGFTAEEIKARNFNDTIIEGIKKVSPEAYGYWLYMRRVGLI